jgi:hypothetical protein
VVTQQPELAIDADGQPIDIPPEVVAWRLRRVKGVGRPGLVHDAMGRPLTLPITATFPISTSSRVPGSTSSIRSMSSVATVKTWRRGHRGDPAADRCDAGGTAPGVASTIAAQARRAAGHRVARSAPHVRFAPSDARRAAQGHPGVARPLVDHHHDDLRHLAPHAGCDAVRLLDQRSPAVPASGAPASAAPASGTPASGAPTSAEIAPQFPSAPSSAPVIPAGPAKNWRNLPDAPLTN